MPPVSSSDEIAQPPMAADVHDASCLANPKCHDIRVPLRVFQRVAGFAQQTRNIDAGEWIGARHNQNVARLHAGKRLACSQHRERAFEAAKIESLFRHRTGSQKLKAVFIIMAMSLLPTIREPVWD
jgi:hypothetical protein